MVEGPGCTLNGEKIRSRVHKGQTLKEIRGSTLTAKGSDPERNSAIQRLKGCQYTGVDTLGKELFMYFGPNTLRVHFGMNGSMRINAAERKPSSGSHPVLEIHMTKDTVSFFDSTVEVRLTDDCKQRLRALQALDVCSPKFSFSCSVEAVRRHGGRMLCDVLLDQAVMPGVGNIIKNEALFDVGLHPAVKVEQLSEEQVQHLVKMTRDFTVLFYKCRKSGSPLHKHYKVYKRGQCRQCARVITVCRLGENGRMTYFCQHCQKQDAGSVDVSKRPARNTLIGWASSGGANENVARKEEEDWACHLCTLINRPTANACDACLTPRAQVQKEDAVTDASPASTASLVRYPCTAFWKPQEERKLNWRSAFGTSTLLFSDLSEKPRRANSPLSPLGSHLNSMPPEREGPFKSGACQGTSGPNYASGGWQRQRAQLPGGETLASYSQPSKKMRIDHSSSPGNKSGAHTTAGTQHASPPCCSSHGHPTLLRVVHKNGDSKGRQFYVCSLPREAKCNFFEWADLHFPSCHHGKRCLMRTVLKLGPNNGRNFYTCSLQKGKQCDYFQWAENGPGVAILPGC
ncbi:endonuclease 8-like 3 isoform X2 [Dunckerocampus dactyliophorus]|uniref:endonuclease 8-like 3 isoform X2 n=1 Tax=Dunckerocampus dactyliophorus TaxID=161453 RepID=UPI00240578DC|nr:endonuclease 8-like 3 isoform X2 [Dunckerocampus dactyliophorus]